MQNSLPGLQGLNQPMQQQPMQQQPMQQQPMQQQPMQQQTPEMVAAEAKQKELWGTLADIVMRNELSKVEGYNG